MRLAGVADMDHLLGGLMTTEVPVTFMISKDPWSGSYTWPWEDDVACCGSSAVKHQVFIVARCALNYSVCQWELLQPFLLESAARSACVLLPQSCICVCRCGRFVSESSPRVSSPVPAGSLCIVLKKHALWWEHSPPIKLRFSAVSAPGLAIAASVTVFIMQAEAEYAAPQQQHLYSW